MKKYFPFLLAVIALSCKRNDVDAYTDGCIIQYKLTLRDNNDYSQYLIENIKQNVSHNATTIAYNKLNSEHIKYLDSIKNEINKSSWELFFKEEYHYSTVGKKFISRTNTFERELLQIITDASLKKRVHYILNTNDLYVPDKPDEIAANNDQDEHKVNTLRFKYLEYYFRGLSNIHIEVVLSSKKRALLELENEFLISQKQTQ